MINYTRFTSMSSDASNRKQANPNNNVFFSHKIYGIKVKLKKIIPFKVKHLTLE